MRTIQTLQKKIPQLEDLPSRASLCDRLPDQTVHPTFASSSQGAAILEQCWFSALVHSSPDLIGIISFDGQWLSLNPAGQSLLQWSGEANRSETLLTSLWETEAENWNQKILPTLMQRGHWQGTLCFRRQTGQPIKLACQWFVIRDRYTNEPLGLATMSRVAIEPVEASEDMSHASDLHQALAHEKTLSQQKSQLLRDISHELRTPLSVIASSAGILQSMSDRLEFSKQQKHFEKIQLKVKQITQVLEGLLLLSRTEEIQETLQLHEADLVALCAELVDEAQMSTTQHEIVFSALSISRVDHSLQPLKQCTSQIDGMLLERVITNLLSNSIKYSPNGGRIYFDLIDCHETIVLQVRDLGIGIPFADRQQLFNSFYRASNAGTIPGSGLGLAIVKRCLELQGGTITVDSEVGVGTTFVVELPK